MRFLKSNCLVSTQERQYDFLKTNVSGSRVYRLDLHHPFKIRTQLLDQKSRISKPSFKMNK